MLRGFVFVMGLLVAQGTATPPSTDWPQWRGPEKTGVAVAKSLPATWSTTENVTWKLALPELSGSTPIVWNDRIFLNIGDGTGLYLLCVDRRKGAELWKKHLGSGNARVNKQNMSTPSPVTDGERVWVMTGTGILKAFDFSGLELWSRDIQKDYGTFGLNWGYASSPLLVRDRLYVQVLHGMRTADPSYVLAIDAASGKTIWRVERPTDAVSESPDAYTTPAVLRNGGKEEIRRHRRRLRHRARPGDRRRVVAGRGAQSRKGPELPPRGVGDRGQRADLCSVACQAADCAARGRARRHHAVARRVDDRPGARRADARGHRQVHFHFLTTAGFSGAATRRPAPKSGATGVRAPEPTAHRPSWPRKLYATSEDGVTTVLEAGPSVQGRRGERPGRLHAVVDRRLGKPALHPTTKFLYCIGR